MKHRVRICFFIIHDFPPVCKKKAGKNRQIPDFL